MTVIEALSGHNRAMLVPQMEEGSHDSTMDYSAMMSGTVAEASIWPQPVSEDEDVAYDATTVYELASTDSSEVEEMSVRQEESPVRKPQKQPAEVAAEQLQESSHSGNFPVISLHDSQHSVVSGLTQTIAPFSGHKDQKVDRLRDELSMLKLSVLQAGHQYSKEEIVSCLDKIQEELCGDKPVSQLSVVSSDGDSSMAGSDLEDEAGKRRKQRRKKSKSLPPVERGRKTPRKPKRKKSIRAEVPPPPFDSTEQDKTPRSSSKGRKKSSGSSRRKQRTVKAHSERASRKTVPVVEFNSEALRKILKGEGTFKMMSTLTEERSQSTRSTKSSTKSKGRSSSLNPKSRSSSVTPKAARKPTSAVFADYSGQLNDTQGLKRKTAPRRKSAPMMGADFDAALFVRQHLAPKAEYMSELNDVELQPVRTRGERKKDKAPRRQSAPMINSNFAETFASLRLEKKQQRELQSSGDDKTRSSGDEKTRSSGAENESTTTKKKKKSKKAKNRQQSMTAVYTDLSGQLNPIDLSTRTEGTERGESVSSATRKKKKSRKPRSRRATMEAQPELSQPVKLERHQTFDDVVSRYQKTKDAETPIVNEKQSRRASISDFTFVSEHSYHAGPDLKEDLKINDAEQTKKIAKVVVGTKEEDDSDIPVPPLSRSKLQQVKRKSTQFLSKVAARGSVAASIISSPRATRRFKKMAKSKGSSEVRA
ncbi:MAG: hypothetical protein SGBAC_007838 [Bacillariaceae sp.]